MAKCRACDAEILWRRTPSGKMNPLDAEPSLEGNVLLVGDDACRTLAGDELHMRRQVGNPLHLSHFATCRFAGSFRKKGNPHA